MLFYEEKGKYKLRIRAKTGIKIIMTRTRIERKIIITRTKTEIKSNNWN